MIITGISAPFGRKHFGKQLYKVKCGRIEHFFYGKKGLKKYLLGLRKIEKRIP